jgi:hypothetical protein
VSEEKATAHLEGRWGRKGEQANGVSKREKMKHELQAFNVD